MLSIARLSWCTLATTETVLCRFLSAHARRPCLNNFVASWLHSGHRRLWLEPLVHALDVEAVTARQHSKSVPGLEVVEADVARLPGLTAPGQQHRVDELLLLQRHRREVDLSAGELSLARLNVLELTHPPLQHLLRLGELFDRQVVDLL